MGTCTMGTCTITSGSSGFQLVTSPVIVRAGLRAETRKAEWGWGSILMLSLNGLRCMSGRSRRSGCNRLSAFSYYHYFTKREKKKNKTKEKNTFLRFTFSVYFHQVLISTTVFIFSGTFSNNRQSPNYFSFVVNNRERPL
jgi:hypothetical protein